MDGVKNMLGKDSALDQAGGKQNLKIEFEYVAPSEPYFHLVKSLLNLFLDGESYEQLDVSGMADHILERASIGSVIVSSLGKDDPEVDPKYAKLSDAEFDRICLKMNATRDVYGFISIVSLTYLKAKIPWLDHIYKYVIAQAE